MHGGICLFDVSRQASLQSVVVLSSGSAAVKAAEQLQTKGVMACGLLAAAATPACIACTSYNSCLQAQQLYKYDSTACQS